MRQELIHLINLINLSYKNKLSFIIISYYNNIIIEFIKLLYKKNLINGFEILSYKKIKIYFKYIDDIAVIQNIKILSTTTQKLSYKYNNLFYKPKDKLINGLSFLKKKYLFKSKQNNKFDLNHLYNLKHLKNFYNLKINNFLFQNENQIILKNIKNKLNHLKNNYYVANTKLNYNIYKKYNKNYKLVYKNNIYNNTLRNFSYFNSMDGLFILSTTEGFMDHKEAYLKNLGGELICKIN